MTPELPLPIADNIVQANVQCNACHRSLVGVTMGNAGCDTQCKPHGFACGLYGLKGRPSPAADEGAREILEHIDACCYGPEMLDWTSQLNVTRNLADIHAQIQVFRKHSAVSPKAGLEVSAQDAWGVLVPLHELYQMWRDTGILRELPELSNELAGAIKKSELRFRAYMVASPPAVSVGEQEKERE